MVKKSNNVLLNKKIRFKKGSLREVGQFYPDQKVLINQMTFEDLEKQTLEEDENKIDEVRQEVTQKKSKKKKITNAITIIFNVLLVGGILLYQVLTTEVHSISEVIGIIKWEYVAVVIFCFAMVMILDSLRTAMLLHQTTKKFRFNLCYKTMAIGGYWDVITPMAAGGQPFQAFYLNKHGVDASSSISVPLSRYVNWQIAWLIVSLFCTIYGYYNFKGTNLISVGSWIGFAINTLIIVGTWILSISKRIGRSIVSKVLKLLQKMKIVKNYEKVYDKVMDTVNGFQTTMARYAKNIKAFLLQIFLYLLQLIAYYIIPYFIYLMFGATPSFEKLLEFTVYAVLIDLAAGFMPVPGGAGVSEVSFTFLFSSTFPNGTVFWAMLMYRFMSFYIYIIQGVVVMLYDSFVGNRKYLWQKKKWELEIESNKFKEKQLKLYRKRAKNGKIRI